MTSTQTSLKTKKVQNVEQFETQTKNKIIQKYFQNDTIAKSKKQKSLGTGK